MKVYVTQGHEKGIGLEVFFKTALTLGADELDSLVLLAGQNSVIQTLKTLNVPFELGPDVIKICHVHLPVIWLPKAQQTQSLLSLELGMKLAETGGVLYTLPTAKDQLSGHAGHTEYFRSAYRRPDLGMFFSSPDIKVLLITDHIPVSDLTSVITAKKIERTVLTAHSCLKKWGFKYERFLLAGLNPHAGERGLIGNEDKRVSLAVKQLAEKNEIEVSGPFPGDTMLRERRSSLDVLVYLYHDQGLGMFKGLNGLIGSNITLGLPYPRFSPDHGTSFGLFGKNEADYRGCSYSLREALKLLKRINGQNSSQQGQSS